MKPYYIAIITLVSPAFTKDIVYELVEIGSIIAAANKNSFIIKSDVSSVLAIKFLEESDGFAIHSRITNILINNKISYYSVVVAKEGDIAWNGSNIKYTLLEKPNDLNKSKLDSN